MPSLTLRQQQVLALRFPAGQRPIAQTQVAEMLGLSLRTVQRLEREALHRLRVETIQNCAWCGWDEA